MLLNETQQEMFVGNKFFGLLHPLLLQPFISQLNFNLLLLLSFAFAALMFPNCVVALLST